MDVVPDVDFSVFGAAALDAEPFQATEEQQAVGEQLREILRGHGFVYAFGLLSSAEIAEAFHGAKGFWAPDVDRAALPRLTPETNVGYGGLGNEALNARRQADLKEARLKPNLRSEPLRRGAFYALTQDLGVDVACSAASLVGLWRGAAAGGSQALRTQRGPVGPLHHAIAALPTRHCPLRRGKRLRDRVWRAHGLWGGDRTVGRGWRAGHLGKQ
ncbi:Thebaine 6-O-demethylase, partial [Durusdinium trenchii]